MITKCLRYRGDTVYKMEGNYYESKHAYKMVHETGGYPMATTGELRAIIEELELVDIGDAANYLGEEGDVDEEYILSTTASLLLADIAEHPYGCDCFACQVQNL